MKKATILNSVIALLCIAIVYLFTCCVVKYCTEERVKVDTWGQRLHDAANFRHRERDSLSKLEDSCVIQSKKTKGMASSMWNLKAINYELSILKYMSEETDSLRKLQF